MLALVPIGSGLERLLGSVRYLHVLFLLTTSNALIQVAIAYIAAYNPIHWYPDLLMDCNIGFSGVIFAMIVIETSLSTAQTRRYIILDTMQFLLKPHCSRVSRLRTCHATGLDLGHTCLSGRSLCALCSIFGFFTVNAKWYLPLCSLELKAIFA